MATKQWIQDVRESTSNTEYKYYPIKYVNKVFATLASHNKPDNACTGCWIDKVDNEKILIGVDRIYGQDASSVLNIISVGF